METEEILRRWRRAAERADEEKVRIIAVNGEYRATSSSHPLGSYLLRNTPDGWTCSCIANAEYGLPCKHLWALASILDLDVLEDICIADEPPTSENVRTSAA